MATLECGGSTTHFGAAAAAGSGGSGWKSYGTARRLEYAFYLTISTIYFMQMFYNGMYMSVGCVVFAPACIHVHHPWCVSAAHTCAGMIRCTCLMALFYLL